MWQHVADVYVLLVWEVARLQQLSDSGPARMSSMRMQA